jgi:alpha-amylase
LKKNNPTKVLDNNPPLPKYTTITLVPESFDFGDKKVNYFENGFNSMINFEFKYDEKDYEFIFSKRYSEWRVERK